MEGADGVFSEEVSPPGDRGSPAVSLLARYTSLKFSTHLNSSEPTQK